MASLLNHPDQISFDRDIFLRRLLKELAGTLEDIVGLEEASGYISIVGQKIGEWMNESYKRAENLEQLPIDKIAAVLVDLKSRIEGDFSILSIDPDKIILTNRTCPFGEYVNGRRSLCMMTSSVFGTITAGNNGYAKVALNETIAGGSDRCMVTVYLSPAAASASAEGIEYFSA